MINKWREMSPKRQRSIVLGVLISIMLLMVVGYAAFSSQLNINGTSNISSNWDIRITNITSDLHGGATNAVEPTYDNEKGLTASFSTNLVSPGDYAEYTITVENQGDIDATLTDISITDTNNQAIVFETSGLSEGDNLLQGESAELLVKVSYSDSVTSQPENTTSNLTVTLTYEQATGAAVPEEPSAGSDLVEMAGVVETGDGLYKDSYEENVYTYRGANPNNYVTFNGEEWRIISINISDNTIKILHNGFSNRAFDTNNGRYQGSNEYCNSITNGCNIWGSSSTLYDVNLSPITELAREVNGTKYKLPSQEADLNEYLNGTYYNGLNETARGMIKEDAVYKAGVLKLQSNQTISTDMQQVSAAKWKGKIGLIDATEYVRASINSSCVSINTGTWTGGNNCMANNWLYISSPYWTMTPYSSGGSSKVLFIASSGNIDEDEADMYATFVRPVVTLKPDVKIISGDGSENNAYQLN